MRTSSERRWSVTSDGVKQQFYNTQMCTYYKEGRCPFTADVCSFAHDVDELRDAPDLTKTKLCPSEKAGLECSHKQEGCQYAHSANELRATNLYYKSRLCKFYQKQRRCSLADKCRFAHGQHELVSNPVSDSSCCSSPIGDRNTTRRVSDSPMVFTPNGWSNSTPTSDSVSPALFHPQDHLFVHVSPDLLRLQSDEPYDD